MIWLLALPMALGIMAPLAQGTARAEGAKGIKAKAAVQELQVARRVCRRVRVCRTIRRCRRACRPFRQCRRINNHVVCRTIRRCRPVCRPQRVCRMVTRCRNIRYNNLCP